MSKISQVNAVIESVKAVVQVREGERVQLTKDQRGNVIDSLVFGFKDGAIEMSEAAQAKYLSDDKALKVYVNGLLTNWLNKSPVLNGGTKYEAKNPGIRKGSDEYKQAIALKKHLLESGALVPVELEGFIAEHAPKSEPKVKTLATDALPEELRKLVG